jgi:hypothetical protein
VRGARLETVNIVLLECFQVSPARPSDTNTIKMKMVLFCVFFLTQLIDSTVQSGVQSSTRVLS